MGKVFENRSIGVSAVNNSPKLALGMAIFVETASQTPQAVNGDLAESLLLLFLTVLPELLLVGRPGCFTC